jgi:hypothetical protein
MNKNKLVSAFNRFVHTESLYTMLDMATVSQSTWYLEVFEDGTARYFPQPGNRYDSEGLLIPVPKLADWEWDVHQELRDYSSAVDQLSDNFDSKLEEITNDYNR